MPKTKRYCLACDLKDDSQLIEEYKAYHSQEKFWPEITESIRVAGIEDMQISLIGNRLFMIMEVNDNFSFEKKAKMDTASAIAQKWESLMWDYQQGLPWATKGEKWMLMETIFKLPS